ncbi:MAG: glutamine synthetase III, partial [Planctomycetia bacterium]|nr:glutamine synthetase III [Planctomycetia bacterium]
FLCADGNGGAFMEFSGKELVMGEPDASSFPSGGIRATFEARGYTAWDPTSPAFILRHPRGATLVIPTVFVSWTGEALDKKTPLLRSIRAVGHQALRILRLSGDTKTRRVDVTMGAEQEYFLIDRRLAALRPDIQVTGRTLFGARPPRGQELDDNYFGAIPERVLAFMSELEHEWLLMGVPVRTRHNEAAPAQFELAPVFETANLATDHQMIVMQMLRAVAARHGFKCLLHEKPFAGINGSGKHNNWSLVTDEGVNLFDPGPTPESNVLFLVFCAAVMRAVHLHGNLLRMSVCGAGNDHRLGAAEAPPAIMSMFLGQSLDRIFERLAGADTANLTGPTHMGPIHMGVPELPTLARDDSDRNRTAPFAFTGNKFEFRAVGASQNPAGSTTVINTIVAESLDVLATRLESDVASGRKFEDAARTLLAETVREHRAILYGGDCYSEEWILESARRELPNIVSSADCLPHINSPSSISLFTKYRVYTEAELNSRFEIIAWEYITRTRIEAASAIEIAGTMILQASLRYKRDLMASATTKTQMSLVTELDGLIDQLIVRLSELKKVYAIPSSWSTQQRADHCRALLLPKLGQLREVVDALEAVVDDELWPLPTYTELLFSR